MYQGHLSDGSSIQRHSAGPAYPFVVMVKGKTVGVLHPDGNFEPVATFTVNDRADRVCCYGYATDHAMALAAAHRVRH